MKNLGLSFLLLLTAAALHAQNEAYLVPRQIYVGDVAVLVLPLPGAPENSADISLTQNDVFFPKHADIDFLRVILERRVRGSRLMIEFRAFVPGLLEFPVIEIGGERFTGLQVTVNSLIDRRTQPALSGPASALAMPGTAVLLYGSMAAFVFLILFSIWFFLKGRYFLRELNKKLIRRRRFAAMKKTEKRLEKAVSKGTDRREILDELSDELRDFLSFLSGSNCRAMTALEFEGLPLDFLPSQELETSFFANYFRSCDRLRFSGVSIEQWEILRLLEGLQKFMAVMESDKGGKT